MIKMSSQEIIITVVSIVFTFISSILGYFLSKNEKAKKYYETYLKVEEKIKELIVVAENRYDKGEQKKKYVLSGIITFLKMNKIELDNKIIEDMIESLIDITKKINI